MSSKALTQIQKLEQTPIPALSQSKFEDMACSILYEAKHVHGIRTTSGAAQRGTEVHAMLREYVDHLVRSKLRKDKAYFEHLLGMASQEAYDACSTFADRYECDYDSVYGTEVRIQLDRNFKPTTDRSAVCYEATLDLIMLPSPTKAVIPDYKSFFMIIDASTFQSKFYPLLLMCWNPLIEEVDFVLEFVRYGAARSVTYTREDLPRLMKLAEASRERQIALHEAESENLQASPGRHCTWCPKLPAGCPIIRTNPYANMTPAERVAFGVWLKEASKQNTQILKDLMLEGGPVAYRDANKVEYVAEFVKVQKRSYPLGQTNEILGRWMEETPGDRHFTTSLTVSGLSSPLGAKKRAALAEQLAAVARVTTQTKFAIGKNDEDEEEQD